MQQSSVEKSVLLSGTDNCLKDFENTPENNRRILGEQDCACDAEHMLSCPPGKKTIDPKSGLVDATNMDAMDSLDSIDLVSFQHNKRREKLKSCVGERICQHGR